MIISNILKNTLLLSSITLSLHCSAMDLNNIPNPMSQQNKNSNISNVNIDITNDNTISTNLNVINNEINNDNTEDLFKEIIAGLKKEEYKNSQVFINQIEKVTDKLRSVTYPTISQWDLLQWVKYAREELPDSKIRKYSSDRAPLEKSLTKLNIIKYNVPKYQQPNLQRFLDKQIIQTKRNREKLNESYYQDVADLKYTLLNQLENNDDFIGTFNDISLNTIENLLINNSNNIVKGIGFDTDKKKKYNIKNNIRYKFDPINGIKKISCYNYIKEILNTTYNVKYNEIMKNYQTPIYNLVKYGLIVPCLKDFISNVSDEDSDWISIFKPLSNNSYLLTIIDNDTNNTLKLKLNVEEEKINIDLDTFFRDDDRNVDLQNQKNDNYYNKNYHKQSFKKKKYI